MQRRATTYQPKAGATFDAEGEIVDGAEGGARAAHSCLPFIVHLDEIVTQYGVRIVVAGFCGQAHTFTHGSDVCILGAATQRRARRWGSVRATGRRALVAGLALGEAGISAPDAEERVFCTPVAV